MNDRRGGCGGVVVGSDEQWIYNWMVVVVVFMERPPPSKITSVVAIVNIDYTFNYVIIMILCA